MVLNWLYFKSYYHEPKKFTQEPLQDNDISIFKNVISPLPINLKLQKDNSPSFLMSSLYKRLVGNLNILTHTIPNLAYIEQTLNQYMQALTDGHFPALQHTLNYVQTTAGQRIILHASNQLSLQAFSKSYWDSCIDTQRSVAGYLLLFGEYPINSKSKKQGNVSKYSSDAKYLVMSSVAS